jgi:hypothetical protein
LALRRTARHSAGGDPPGRAFAQSETRQRHRDCRPSGTRHRERRGGLGTCGCTGAAGWCRAERHSTRRIVLHTSALCSPMVGVVLGEASRCCGRRSSDANHPHRLAVDWAAASLSACSPGPDDRRIHDDDAKSGNRERGRTAPGLPRVGLGLRVPGLWPGCEAIPVLRAVRPVLAIGPNPAFSHEARSE